jgi:hypothetical protein
MHKLLDYALGGLSNVWQEIERPFEIEFVTIVLRLSLGKLRISLT